MLWCALFRTCSLFLFVLTGGEPACCVCSLWFVFGCVYVGMLLVCQVCLLFVYVSVCVCVIGHWIAVSMSP